MAAAPSTHHRPRPAAEVDYNLDMDSTKEVQLTVSSRFSATQRREEYAPP